MQRKGIDVSKWQGRIDWPKVKAAGIEFAMVRTSYGQRSLDEYGVANIKCAQDVGIDVGVYHYCYAKTVAAAKAEAVHLLRVIKPYKLTYPVVLDLEDPSQAGLGKQLLTDMVIVFLSAIEDAGYYAMLYANKHWLTNILDYDRLKRFDVWLAEWREKPTWSGNFGIWQYTDKGKVPGISGNVDLNIAYRDYPEIINAAGLNGLDSKPVTPKPTPAPKPTTQAKTYTVRKGDTLSGIAARYKTTVAELVLLNSIKNQNLIFPGQVLKLPVSAAAPVAVYHTVRKGETLSGIAGRYKTTVAQLVRLNNIKNPDLIFPKQRIRVK